MSRNPPASATRSSVFFGLVQGVVQGVQDVVQDAIENIQNFVSPIRQAEPIPDIEENEDDLPPTQTQTQGPLSTAASSSDATFPDVPNPSPPASQASRASIPRPSSSSSASASLHFGQSPYQDGVASAVTTKPLRKLAEKLGQPKPKGTRGKGRIGGTEDRRNDALTGITALAEVADVVEEKAKKAAEKAAARKTAEQRSRGHEIEKKKKKASKKSKTIEIELESEEEEEDKNEEEDKDEEENEEDDEDVTRTRAERSKKANTRPSSSSPSSSRTVAQPKPPQAAMKKKSTSRSNPLKRRSRPTGKSGRQKKSRKIEDTTPTTSASETEEGPQKDSDDENKDSDNEEDEDDDDKDDDDDKEEEDDDDIDRKDPNDVPVEFIAIVAEGDEPEDGTQVTPTEFKCFDCKCTFPNKYKRLEKLKEGCVIFVCECCDHKFGLSKCMSCKEKFNTKDMYYKRFVLNYDKSKKSSHKFMCKTCGEKRGFELRTTAFARDVVFENDINKDERKIKKKTSKKGIKSKKKRAVLDSSDESEVNDGDITDVINNEEEEENDDEEVKENDEEKTDKEVTDKIIKDKIPTSWKVDGTRIIHKWHVEGMKKRKKITEQGVRTIRGKIASESPKDRYLFRINREDRMLHRTFKKEGTLWDSTVSKYYTLSLAHAKRLERDGFRLWRAPKELKHPRPSSVSPDQHCLYCNVSLPPPRPLPHKSGPKACTECIALLPTVGRHFVSYGLEDNIEPINIQGQNLMEFKIRKYTGKWGPIPYKSSDTEVEKRLVDLVFATDDDIFVTGGPLSILIPYGPSEELAYLEMQKDSPEMSVKELREKILATRKNSERIMYQRWMDDFNARNNLLQQIRKRFEERITSIIKAQQMMERGIDFQAVLREQIPGLPSSISITFEIPEDYHDDDFQELDSGIVQAFPWEPFSAVRDRWFATTKLGSEFKDMLKSKKKQSAENISTLFSKTMRDHFKAEGKTLHYAHFVLENDEKEQVDLSNEEECITLHKCRDEITYIVKLTHSPREEREIQRDESKARPFKRRRDEEEEEDEETVASASRSPQVTRKKKSKESERGPEGRDFVELLGMFD
jgi:hypothetical protein